MKVIRQYPLKSMEFNHPISIEVEQYAKLLPGVRRISTFEPSLCFLVDEGNEPVERRFIMRSLEDPFEDRHILEYVGPLHEGRNAAHLFEIYSDLRPNEKRVEESVTGLIKEIGSVMVVYEPAFDNSNSEEDCWSVSCGDVKASSGVSLLFALEHLLHNVKRKR